MNDLAVPDPVAVDRGNLRLIAALQAEAAPLEPAERETILGVLRLLESAQDALQDAPADDVYAHAAGVLVGLIDGYRRHLARLGGQR